MWIVGYVLYAKHLIQKDVTTRGVATKFRPGEGDGFRLRGADSGESKPATPKFRFLLGFRTLYLGNFGKSENFEMYSENFP